MNVPAVHIKIDGAAMNAAYEVISVDVHSEANKIPWAEICLLDGDASLRKFGISESGDFDLGKKIAISLGYVDAPSSMAPIFEGLVTRHTIEMDTRGQLLRIECRHPAFLMTKVRKRMVFEEKTDMDLFAELAKSTKGLCSIKGQALKAKKFDQMIQFDATDWDFLLHRCEANGWLVFADGSNLTVQAIAPPQGEVDQNGMMDFNINEMFSLELALDGEAQYEKAIVKAVEYPGELPQAESPGTSNINPGSSKPQAINHLSKGVIQELVSGAELTTDELTAWAQASVDRARMAYYRGRFELQGNSLVELGKACKINGIGTRFNGMALVSGLRQRVSTAAWTTDVQIGMPQPAATQAHSSMAPAANGLVPAVSGIHIGIVQAFKQNKKNPNKILIYLPALNLKTNLIWAQVGMPFAGGGGEAPAGMIFWPDAGDEVIVGFLNDDPRSAIVLGSLYNSQSKSPYPLDKDNFKKGLVTKQGSKIEFDDKEEELILSTKEKVEVRLNEKKQSLTITEKEGQGTFMLDKTGISLSFKENSIKITEEGILITAGKHNIDMKAAGISATSKDKLEMTGSKGIKMDGGAQVEIVGKKIDLK